MRYYHRDEGLGTKLMASGYAFGLAIFSLCWGPIEGFSLSNFNDWTLGLVIVGSVLAGWVLFRYVVLNREHRYPKLRNRKRRYYSLKKGDRN